MTQTDSPDLNATMDVVCDHCSTGYHVSIVHFANSFKHRFHCPACEQSWDEYLDIPVWEEIRGPAQQLARQEQERQEQILQAEMQAIRAAEAKERAAQEAEERERQAAQEAAEQEAQAQEAERLAAEQAEQEQQAAAEAERLYQEETERLEAEAKSAAEEEAPSEQKAKKAKRGSKKAAPPLPKGVVGKILLLVNPVRWGQFSIAPLVFGILFLVLVYTGTAGYFYVQRAEIVQANPLAAGPYHAVGIPVSPVDGLDARIADLERKDIKIPGERTQYEFNIRAWVRNVSGVERRLPYLRFSVLNIDGERLDFWDVDLTGRVLQAGEEVNVATMIPEELVGDERVESFVARLISKAEREYLGIGKEVDNIAATAAS